MDVAQRRRDNLLGPGLAGEIKVEMSAGRINAGPDDLGDGRYRFLLSPPVGVDPSITLAVAEQTLFRGKFSALRAARRKR